MRVLQVYNFYQQPGGEDHVFRAECELLRRHGDEVEQYSVHNDIIRERSGARVALETIWNRNSYRDVLEILVRFRPDVMHCYNTFPVASPAIYYAAGQAGVPVVQTVQNYRLVCPAATLLRDGQVCEACLRRSVPYPGVIHACYRGSRMASAVVAGMLAVHRMAGTWRNKVHTYIAVTEFLKGEIGGRRSSGRKNYG